MEQQHTPESEQFFYGGADADTDVNLKKKETYVDSQNMRPTSVDGHSGAINKIHGEVVQYPNIDNSCALQGGTGTPFALSYKCLASYQILNHLVEFWADYFGVLVPYVRVDGWVVLKPTTIADFPISYNFLPQVHGNDSCVGGEIFYTDDSGVCPPFRLNITDMLTNAGVVNNVQTCANSTSKYYSAFNISQVQIQPPASADHPVFVEIVPTGSTPNVIGQAVTSGTGGQKVGSYQYGVQFVDTTGNTTNWSELTPQIPLPYTISLQPTSEEQIYPGTRVQGDYPGSISSLGIHIRFRVNNPNNYSYVQVRRVSWNVGAAINSLPNDDSVIKKIPITNGQSNIIDFYDYDNSTISPVTEEAETNNLTAISAAKGIRYYNSRLTLWNITYASRSTTGVNISSGSMYPFIRPLGYEGYNDIWNDVYRKKYFGGERYGWSWVAWDSDFNAAFAIPIPGFTDYETPNRRDTIPNNSLIASAEAATNFGNTSVGSSDNVKAVDSTGAISQVFEVFDTVGAIGKGTAANPGTLSNTYNDNKNVLTGGVPQKWSLNYTEYDYQPFRPCNDSDPTAQFSFNPTSEVGDGTISDSTIDGLINPGTLPAYGQAYNSMFISNGGLQYNPQGFKYNLWALGMIFDGTKVTGIPSWVAAFSIMRTEQANRVVAQGQNYYKLYFDNTSTSSTDKQLSEVVWDSPDFLSGYVNTQNIIDGVGNQRYKLQTVSPLGMFTECWYGMSVVYQNSSSTVVSTHSANFIAKPGNVSDMISYCRILRDTNNAAPNNGGVGNLFNPSYNANDNMNTIAAYASGGYHYTGFDSWRNPSNGNTPYQEFTINSLSNSGATVGAAPRLSAWLINVNNIYATNQCNGIDFKDSGTKSFHEPLYVGNIVDDTQHVPQGNTQTYYQTGTWVKMRSVIGYGTGSAINLTLVDERWQDCIPDLSPNYPMANQPRFVWLQNGINSPQAFLNVTYYTSGNVTTIEAAITANGFYQGNLAQKCDGTQPQVYGVYTHTITPYQFSNGATSASENTYTLNFNIGYYPSAGEQVIVMYDSCAPVEVFGGDSYVGEYNYPVADCRTDNNGSPYSGDNWVIGSPLPYRVYQANENTHVIIDDHPSGSSLDQIQQFNTIRQIYTPISANNPYPIRQLLCNGIVESRINTALDFGLRFANTNYVITPYAWDSTTNIYNTSGGEDYYQNNAPYYGYGDFPTYISFRNNGYHYGGFVLGDQTFNIDYSEIPNIDTESSQPAAGFVEKLNYCTRCAWSPQRSPAQEDSPNLLNFPSVNVYDFDDATGEIKRAWDSAVGGLEGNVYAFTENGIVMGLTNKSILTEISGNQLATIGAVGDTNFIQDEVWLTRNIGMNDQTWRTAAEWNNKLWFCNKSAPYSFDGKTPKDISEGYNSVLKSILQNIGAGYSSYVNGTWNNKYKEYMVCFAQNKKIFTTDTVLTYNSNPPTDVINDSIVDIQGGRFLWLTSLNINYVTEIYIINNLSTPSNIYYDPSNPSNTWSLIPGYWRAFWNPTAHVWQFDTNYQDLCNNLVYNDEMGKWVGNYKYLFDQYVSDIEDNQYGSRYNVLYKLDTGYAMNGNNIQALVTGSTAEPVGKSKEFWYQVHNVETKPDIVNFYLSRDDYENNVVYSQTNTLVNPLALKNYGQGWSQYISRAMNSPYYRTQGNYLIYQIQCAQPSEFRLYSSTIKYKLLI